MVWREHAGKEERSGIRNLVRANKERVREKVE
jgi:hypothetical protein